MIATRAPSRLSCASGRIRLGRRVPAPVRVTTPMMMPTQAAAPISGTPPRDAPVSARMKLGKLIRVSRFSELNTITTASATLTARNTVKPAIRSAIRLPSAPATTTASHCISLIGGSSSTTVAASFSTRRA